MQPFENCSKAGIFFYTSDTWYCFILTCQKEKIWKSEILGNGVSVHGNAKNVTNEKNKALIEIISKFVSPGLFVITYLQKLIDTKNCIVKIQ